LLAYLRILAPQTLRHFEVVAIDDGSIDGTPDLLRAWARRHRWLGVERQPAAGIVAALNRGLAAARAPLVARMDADDRAHPDRLAAQTRLLRLRPEVGVVGSLVRSFPAHRVTEGMRRYEAWLNALRDHGAMWRDLFVESPLPHPSVMFRADLVRRLGGYRDCPWPEDYDLWMRLFAAGVRIAKVPRVLLLWREGGTRLSRVDPRYSPAAFRACKVHYLREMHLRGRDTIAVWGAGKEGKSLVRHLKRQGLRVTRFIDIDPNKIGRRVLGAPVVAPDDLTRDDYLVIAVGAQGARPLIRAWLTEHGWREPDDYRTLA